MIVKRQDQLNSAEALQKEFISGTWKSRKHSTSKGAFILWKHTRCEYLVGFFLGPALGGHRNYGAWILAETQEELEKGKKLLGGLCEGWTVFILQTDDESLPSPESIKESVPDCDQVVIDYIRESIICIRVKAVLSAAFMLGAASEYAITRLIEEYTDAIRDTAKRQAFAEKTKKLSIGPRFEKFVQSYNSSVTYQESQKNPESEWEIDESITSVFDIWRLTRNKIGHPKKPLRMDSKMVRLHLGHFKSYVGRIYEMIKYFQSQGIDI
jgi:hypothetical protein